MKKTLTFPPPPGLGFFEEKKSIKPPCLADPLALTGAATKTAS